MPLGIAAALYRGRITGAKGPRNSVCLPMNVIFRSSANMTAMPTTKSQFEVCGATAITNLLRSGTSPSTRQRSSARSARPKARVGALPRLQQIVDRLLHQPGLLEVARQLHRHLLDLLTVDRFEDAPDRLVQIGPLHLGQAVIHILLEQLMPEAVERQALRP